MRTAATSRIRLPDCRHTFLVDKGCTCATRAELPRFSEAGGVAGSGSVSPTACERMVFEESERADSEVAEEVLMPAEVVEDVQSEIEIDEDKETLRTEGIEQVRRRVRVTEPSAQ